MSVRFTPDERAVIDDAAKQASLSGSEFIRRTMLLAAATPPVADQAPIQQAALALKPGRQQPTQGPTKRVVIGLPEPIAEALAIGAKAAKLKKNQVVTAALGNVPGAVANGWAPDHWMLRCSADLIKSAVVGNGARLAGHLAGQQGRA